MENLITQKSITEVDDVDDFNWNLDWLANTNISNILNIDTIISQPGPFQVSLIGFNDNLCKDTALFIDTVFPNPVAEIIADSLKGCEIHTVLFNDNSLPCSCFEFATQASSIFF